VLEHAESDPSTLISVLDEDVVQRPTLAADAEQEPSLEAAQG